MSVTWLTFQLASGWLNAVVLANISPILVTRLTSHEDNGWSKVEAIRNMLCIVVTFIVVTWLTFQMSSGRLNAAAPANMSPILVTQPTSHEDNDWSNDEAPQNMLSIVVT
eukprot:gene13196-gene14057